jgi:hypothetical protein
VSSAASHHYARRMEPDPIAPGDLVSITTAGPVLDAIVVELPSAAKAVVAVVDRTRGPVLRTVDASTLSPRAEDGPNDRALRLLIRRTPTGEGPASRSGASARTVRSGHTRSAPHRSNG